MADYEISGFDFQDAVQAQEERPDLEFKRTLDLSQSEGKAKLAKEICALANHGGGWIVFGREDNGDVVTELDDEIKFINTDTVNNIAKAYLNDPPYCILRKTEYNGIELPVIRISEHETVPVCGIKNGPNDEKGKTIGIKQGVYYNRSGISSEQMISAHLWNEVIHRCVLKSKTKLLTSISTLLSDPVNEINLGNLDTEVDYLVNKWREETNGIDSEFTLDKNFIIFGFELLETSDKKSFDKRELMRFLGELPSCYRGVPHIFFNPDRDEEEAPCFIENSCGDGYEANIGKKNANNIISTGPSLWRINDTATTGVSIETYWEDTRYLKNGNQNWERGAYIWFGSQISSINGFLNDVWSLANNIEFAGEVRIVIVYNGLKNRILFSPRPSEVPHYNSHPAKQDHRKIDYTFQIDALAPEIRHTAVATIAQKLITLFGGEPVRAKNISKILDCYYQRRG